jgi:DNA-binding protein H-NS
VKESNTAASKEMAAKLAQMRAERDKQDAVWTFVTSSTEVKYSAVKEEVQKPSITPNVLNIS